MTQANNSILKTNDVLHKHKSFWLHTDVDKPLIQKFHFNGFKAKPYPLSDGRSIVSPEQIAPDQVDIHRLLGLDKPHPDVLEGYKVNWNGPIFPEAWMESLIGCPIYVSAFSCTAKPVTNDIEQFASNFQLSSALQSPWLKIMDKVIETAVDASDGQIGVRQLHMRGIIDMLAACLGEESFCMGLLDNGSQMKQLIHDFSQLYTEVALKGLTLRPCWNGGYVSTWGLFAPGTLLDYQVDASTMIQAGLYKEFFLEYDSSIISNFEYSILHVHNCGLHIIEALLEIGKLNAIEISLDRETGDWNPAKIIEYCEKIQSAKKSVLIYGQLSQPEVNELLISLNPIGLGIFYWE
jgi:hypothetical protein